MPPPSIAVAGVDFGWGSAGKLSAILTALRARPGPPLRLVLVGSRLGLPLLSAHPIASHHDVDATDVAALAGIVERENLVGAVVVLDPDLACSFTTAGVPTTYVDSLPFLWTDGDVPGLPTGVSAYCAQRFPGMPGPASATLDAVEHLYWVEPVIAPPSRRTGRPRRSDRVLVNLGGLRAPHLPDWTAYPRLVLPAVLDALATAGYRDVHLAGNLSRTSVADLDVSVPAGVRLAAGTLDHDRFLRELDECALLLTSPGLTTLLEAGAREVPVVTLPPQNLSQVFNQRFHAEITDARFAVPWPPGVFTDAAAIGAAAIGETAALTLIYRGIAGADRVAVRTALRTTLRQVLATVPDADVEWGGLAEALGTRGAEQVAEIAFTTMTTGPGAALRGGSADAHT